jgi:hypothetical protein
MLQGRSTPMAMGKGTCQATPKTLRQSMQPQMQVHLKTPR